MKKIIVCFVTVLCLLTFCFAGCGKDEFDGSFKETSAQKMGTAFTTVVNTYAEKNVGEIFNTDLLKGAEIKLELSLESKNGEGALGFEFNKLTAELDAKLLTDLANKKISASVDAKVETKDNNDSKNDINAEVNARFVDEDLFLNYDLEIPSGEMKGKTKDAFSDFYALFSGDEGVSLASLLERVQPMLSQKLSVIAGNSIEDITGTIEDVASEINGMSDNIKLYSEEKDGKITKLKVEVVDLTFGEDSPKINGQAVLVIEDNMIDALKVEIKVSNDEMDLDASLVIKAFTDSIDKPSDADSYKGSIFSLIGSLIGE